MQRRDAFSMLRSTQSETLSADTSIPDSPLENLELPAVVRPLDFIPAAEPHKKRERGWEKAHRAEVATYRGIPAETHQVLLQIADALVVPVDEIARAFLEYSLGKYQEGLLLLYPHPKSQRMTLFPDGSQAQSAATRKWLQQAFPIKKNGRKEKKGKTPKRWETRVTYRIPPKLKAEIKEVADSHDVGVGELVLFFFLHALKAFETQSLQFQTHPKISGNTLFE